ncbi:hypothetical protein [Desulfovibrio piger]|uniref:hypothetical protein n=1 Tax=Desulfovibrio piger TaxID=901 RepID=UPI0026EBDDA7|nr:hypothetical protein [Desulfovibrio piger]
MINEFPNTLSLYIRQKLYEDGILRRLFESRTVTADELDPIVEPDGVSTDDMPSIICEIEPDASQATFVPFKGTGERRYFHGKRFRIPFAKIEAERITKSKFELMTIRMPITDWLKENQVKMIQEEEDSKFIDTLNEIVADNAAEQAVSVATSTAANTFKDAFAEGMKAMIRMRLPLGKVLMHKNTYIDSLKLKTEDIGFAPQEARFNRGVEGEETFLGLPVVTTIKDNLVKENEIFFFTQPEFFIKFFFLQDATLFMKTEADLIHFHTYESPGLGIGNTKGVVKVTLE